MPTLSLHSYPTLVLPVLSKRNRLRILCVPPKLPFAWKYYVPGVCKRTEKREQNTATES